MSRVQDIVRDRQLFYVEETDTVAGAARRMEELQCGAILVLWQGELRGVFSERDLMRRVVLEHRDPETTPVRDGHEHRRRIRSMNWPAWKKPWKP